MPVVNKELFITKAFEGMVSAANFGIRDAKYPTISDGEFIVQSSAFSVDPYLRGKYRGSEHIDKVIDSNILGKVIDSKNNKFKVGDLVAGILPLRLFNSSNGENISVIQNPFNIPETTFIGVLGMPGLTAYGGVTQGLQLKKDDIVLVSGAAGAVGSAVGQIARALGAKKVIGIAGGEDKCRIVKEKYGFDDCIDYKQCKTSQEINQALNDASPEGYDAYFDNVGGYITAGVWDLLRRHARVAICGSISNYNSKPELVEDFLFKLIYKAITVRGIIVTDFVADPSFIQEFYEKVPRMIRDDQIKFDETILHGFDKLPEAFVGLFTGMNVGKMIVKL